MTLPAEEIDTGSPGEHARDLAHLARHILKSRRRRAEIFPDIGLGEPAWDMLLDLYAHQTDGKAIYVSSLCTAAAAPYSTALRWIRQLCQDGHFVREADMEDGRRTHVRLTDAALKIIEGYLLKERDLLAAMFRDQRKDDASAFSFVRELGGGIG